MGYCSLHKFDVLFVDFSCESECCLLFCCLLLFINKYSFIHSFIHSTAVVEKKRRSGGCVFHLKRTGLHNSRATNPIPYNEAVGKTSRRRRNRDRTTKGVMLIHSRRRSVPSPNSGRVYASKVGKV